MQEVQVSEFDNKKQGRMGKGYGSICGTYIRNDKEELNWYMMSKNFEISLS